MLKVVDIHTYYGDSYVLQGISLEVTKGTVEAMLSFERAGDGYRIGIPSALRTTHEDHFAAVLEEFIARIDSAEQPLNLGPDLITKYALLAHARELSHRST